MVNTKPNRKSRTQHGRQSTSARRTGSKLDQSGTEQQDCAMGKHAFEHTCSANRRTIGNYANDRRQYSPAKPPPQTWLRRDNLEIPVPRKISIESRCKRGPTTSALRQIQTPRPCLPQTRKRATNSRDQDQRPRRCFRPTPSVKSSVGG